VQPWGKWAECAECARDGQPERFHEQVQCRELKCSGALYQLARNRYRYLGVPFRVEFDPRSGTTLIGILKRRFVECCDSPLFRVKSHRFAAPLITGDQQVAMKAFRLYLRQMRQIEAGGVAALAAQ
jgi:hypothetical protein